MRLQWLLNDLPVTTFAAIYCTIELLGCITIFASLSYQLACHLQLSLPSCGARPLLTSKPAIDL